MTTPTAGSRASRLMVKANSVQPRGDYVIGGRAGVQGRLLSAMKRALVEGESTRANLCLPRANESMREQLGN